MSVRKDLQLMQGGIDIHVHQAPSLFHRHYFMDVVRDAKERGLRAVVLKSHHMMTTDRAAHAASGVPGIDIFGSITLNFAHGGINPFAVDHALRMGARVVWMPTIDTAQQKTHFGALGGYGKAQSTDLPDFYAEAEPIRLCDANGTLVKGLKQVLQLIKDHEAILAVGHVTPFETKVLVKAAAEMGITKIVIDHPFLPFTELSDIEQQKELADAGAMLNYAFSMITPKWFSVSVPNLVAGMEAIGYDRLVISSDLGQLHNPLPAEGLRMYVQLLLEEGVSPDNIEKMFHHNTARMLYGE